MTTPLVALTRVPFSPSPSMKVWAYVRSGTTDCAYAGYADAECAEIVDAAEVGLVPYTSSELHLWMDKSHELASKDPLAPTDLEGRSLLIPANKKHESWCRRFELHKPTLVSAVASRRSSAIRSKA